ncbi:MAG: DUF3179 domain-containing protein [Proteobacteria bacterium]|nr:DUF3179 domain-containing protein [Pseudomonadota bacterium]
MHRIITWSLLGMTLMVFSAFSLDNTIVPEDEILSGGPPKDGIPAILRPKFIPADEGDFLDPDDQVIGFRSGGEARAYPIKILNWHEVVNDSIGERPIAVTF